MEILFKKKKTFFCVSSSDDGDIESIPEPNSDSYPESNSEPRSVEDESDLEEDPR